MKYLSFAAFLVVSAATIHGQQAATTAVPVPQDDKQVTLTGCVVKGTGGFVLSGATETSTAAAPAPAVTPVPRYLYWLDDDDKDLEGHAGQRVEVIGKISGDIDRGEIEVEREGGMIKLDFKAKDKKISVKLPDTPAGTAAAVGTTGVVPTDKEKDVPFLVRKVEVKSVKMLAATCQ